MKLKRPPLFTKIVDALNLEGEFSPNAVSSKRLVTMPDGSKAIRDFLPYWVQLRDEASMFYSHRDEREEEHLSKLVKESKSLAQIKANYGERSREFKAQQVKMGIARTQEIGIGKIPPRRPDELADDAVYRKAQETFVSSFQELLQQWREWTKSNKEWDRMFAKHLATGGELLTTVNRFLRRNPLMLQPAVSGPWLLVPEFRMAKFPPRKDNPCARARRAALSAFVQFVQHPLCDRLGKCVRCGRYFYGRPGQKCCPYPRRCGSSLAAIRATNKRWKEQRIEKLRLAQKAIADWKRLKRRPRWKTWVTKRIAISEKFLSRAVNGGELKPPSENGR